MLSLTRFRCLGYITLLSLLLGPMIVVGKDHFSTEISRTETEEQTIASIFKELDDIATVKDRAVAKIKVNLKRIGEIDKKLTSVDRDILEHKNTIQQNVANCKGQYKEPEFSYWLEFCTNLQKRGEDLEAIQSQLSKERDFLLVEAKRAEAKYDNAEGREEMLLAQLRINRILSHPHCGECPGSTTLEAEVACYQACWDNTQKQNSTLPSPYDNDPSVVKPYWKKKVLSPAMKVSPEQMKDAMAQGGTPGREAVTSIVLDALTVGNQDWSRTLLFIQDALRRYPNDPVIKQGAARILGMADLASGDTELWTLWESMTDVILIPVEKESYEYSTWSLIKQAEAKQDLALLNMRGGIIGDNSLREAEAALRLLEMAQMDDPSNAALSIMVNYWEGVFVNWSVRLDETLEK